MQTILFIFISWWERGGGVSGSDKILAIDQYSQSAISQSNAGGWLPARFALHLVTSRRISSSMLSREV